MNLAVALATRDLSFVWDDDDIHLANRLRFFVGHVDLKLGSSSRIGAG
jgi:hypothetical protein